MSVVLTIALLGLLASVSPSTLIVFILLLDTARARVNAAAFLAGWSISLVIVFAASYAVGGTGIIPSGSSGDTAVKAIEILLGAALVVAAVRQWIHRDRPRTGSGVTRRFTARLKQLHPWEAAAVGVFEQPWTMTAAAAVLLVRHHAELLIVVLAFLAFALLSTATIGLIFVFFDRRPGQAEAYLSDLRDRLVKAGPVIFVIVSLVVGGYLIADGAAGLAGH